MYLPYQGFYGVLASIIKIIIIKKKMLQNLIFKLLHWINVLRIIFGFIKYVDFKFDLCTLIFFPTYKHMYVCKYISLGNQEIVHLYKGRRIR